MTLAQAIPGYTPTQWATELLKGFGAPVTAQNIDTVTRWANAESGGYNPNVAGGRYNPLNVVTQSNDKHTGQGGSQGDIADFGNMQDGIAATVRLFTGNHNAAAIVQGLRTNNQPATFAGIQSFYKTWGGGINLGGAPPPDTSVGQPGPGGGTGTTVGGTTPSAGNVDSDCVWKLTMPGPIPNFCVTHSQGRALLGAVTMFTGAALIAFSAGLASRRQIVSTLTGVHR